MKKNIYQKLRMNLWIRIFLLVAALITSSVLIISLFLLNNLQNTMSEEFKEKGMLLATGFSERAAEGILIEDTMVLEKFLAQLFAAKDILYATIYEETGLILTQKSIIEETPSKELMKEMARKAETRSLNVDINGKTKVLDIRVPVYYEADIIGCIQIGLSLARMDEEISKRIINLSLFVIGFVLLSLVASFAFARTLTMPMKDLLQGVKRIGAGDLSHFVKMKRSDEIGELAVAVNEMSSELLQKTTSIENLNQEIVERKKAEEALEIERKQLLSMFDGMDEVIYVFDPTTYEILYMNGPARKQWGNGIGQKCYHVIQGNDSPCSFCNNKNLLSENPHIQEIQNNINDRWYRTYYKAIRWSDGRMVYFGLAVDITEQRQTEEELQKVQRLESIGVLAGGIAHDLNNLLTIILTNITVARIHDVPSDRDKSMAEAERASMQMKNLAQQLLTFSKGGAPIRKLTDIGDDLQRSVSFALGGSNVKCEFSIPDDLWAAEVDGGQLDQVINNMVINANQAMPDGGIINVHAENMTINEEHGLPLEPGNYIKISFADQGVGIPANLLSKIFDPFFSTKEQGNGLGLATSYSIIKKHGGYITVESEIDVGTVFHIYIPASLERILVQKEEKNQGPVMGHGRILIMDDEAALREAMTRIGKFLGYQVIGAADGIEALEKYENAMKSDPLDLVIMDLTIPGSMGGKEAIQKLREMDPKAKAIVSSGYSNDPVMADFRKYGFSGVIAKPYEIQELSIELNRVITEAGAVPLHYG